MKRESLQSLTCNLTAYYHAVFKDIAWLYHRPSEMKKDLSRFSHELVANGSRFSTIDLPALGKHFDMCLDQGVYTPSRLTLGRVGKTEKVPLLLRDLYLHVFDTEGKLRPNPSIDAIQALRVLCYSTKKIRLACKEQRILEELVNFERIEDEARTPSLDWSGDDLDDCGLLESRGLHFADLLLERPGHSHDPVFDFGSATADRLQNAVGNGLHRDPHDQFLLGVLPILQRVCDVVFSSLGNFDEELPGEKPKHGPGVTAEQGKWDDKFQFPNWPAKLEHIYPYDWYGSPNLGDHIRSYGAHRPGVAEQPSRLIAVPKTQKSPRLIAAEPTAHQWIQQLVWNQLEHRLERNPIGGAIRFRDQSRNQMFARLGSIDGSYATIDLSSASDRLTCWVVERACRSNPTLLLRLHACRTRWVTYQKRGSQFWLELQKFAPMGSACTFPVQTIVYACAAVAVLMYHQTSWATNADNITRCSSQLSVFGDDIVLPTYAAGDLADLLSALGLRVNASKTYSRGLFRESCGSEWWNGNDVSVPYLLNVPARSTLTTMSSHLGVRNNFYKRGYWATAKWLDSWIRGQDKIPTALLGSEMPGVLAVTHKSLKLRFSKRYHRFEEYGYYPTIRRKTVSRTGWSALMKWFHEEPSQEVIWTSKLTLSEASFWKLGWFPTHHEIQHYVVNHGYKTA